MKQPSLEHVRQAMPARFRKTTDWATEDGEDCKAIRGSFYMLFLDGEWVIQAYSLFSDPSVGIFGQEEPGAVRFTSDDAIAAMKQFILLEADLEADDHTHDFAAWLASAEYAELAEHEARP